MADFLSRLAERSLGTAALARPVIAPLFATGSELDPDGPEPEPSALAEAFASTPRGNEAATAPVRPEGAALPESIDREAKQPPARRVEVRSSESVESADSGPLAAARTAGSPTPTDERGRTPTATARSTAGPRRPALTELAAARPRRQAASFASEAEPPPTIVRVSIGRVDVRAVAPAPAAARPAPERPRDRVSLDEYLRAGKRER